MYASTSTDPGKWIMRSWYRILPEATEISRRWPCSTPDIGNSHRPGQESGSYRDEPFCTIGSGIQFLPFRAIRIEQSQLGPFNRRSVYSESEYLREPVREPFGHPLKPEVIRMRAIDQSVAPGGANQVSAFQYFQMPISRRNPLCRDSPD
jgi:hypothetical protein